MSGCPDELPVGSLVTVEMEIRLPVAASVDHAEEWLRYSFRDNGCLKHGNPLVHHEPEPFGNSFHWGETGKVGRVEEFNHQSHPNGSTTYNVRYIREYTTVAQATATPQTAQAEKQR